jgi:spermidine dehydrogenase
MRGGIHFGADAFTRNTVLPMDSERLVDGAPPGVAQELPLSPRGRSDLARLMSADLMPGASQTVRIARLKQQSYLAYLASVAGANAEVQALFKRQPNTFWGLDFDALSALEGYRLGAPGFTGLDDAVVDHPYPDDEPYLFHFPDGNAGIARLLVRRLIPDIADGSTMADVVTARFDYARLDRPESNVRIRLSSTVVRVLPSVDGVDLVYARGRSLTRVRGKRCILACYPRMIPHILPELPAAQSAAMQEAVRTPLVYTNVVLRNWQAFAAAGVDRLYCPTGTYAGMMLDFPVSLGDYRCPRSPDEPIVVHMSTAPVPGDGGHPKDQFKAGRQRLLATSFTDMERDVRLQLATIFGGHGFDPARDILALTVNRWPHGYAREYNELWDTWAEEDAPWVHARRPFGNIVFAGSDTQGKAYADSAIDAAHRAVSEFQ